MTTPLHPPFVGRTDLLPTFATALAEVEDGIGGALRLVGEAGIGKTRTLSHVLADAPVPVLWAAAEEAEQGRPFAALARTLELDLTLRQPTAADAINGDATWLAIDRLVEAVDRLAHGRPLVLVIDDLHWADHGTWLAAAALARRAPEAGLLLLTGHRPLPPTRPAPVPLEALGAPQEIRPLNPADALELASSVRGEHLDHHLAGQIHRAAGNPFLTIELAQWAETLPQPDGAPDEAGMSPGLRDAVLDRVDRLTPATLATIRSLALLGRPGTTAELAQLTGRLLPEVLEHLEDAASRGLLVVEDDRVRFHHDLVREAVATATPASAVAAQAHRAAHGRPDPWVAKHLAAVAEPGDVRAAQVLLTAAREPGLAPQLEAELLEGVLRTGIPPEEPPGSIELALVIALARSSGLAAASTRAEELIADLPAGDPALGALQRMAARLDVSQGRSDRAIATLQQLGTGEDLLAAQARADQRLAEVLGMRRPEALDEARAEAQLATDPTVRCISELTIAVAAMRAGRSAESVAAATAAVAQAALDPRLSQEIHPEVFLVNALFYAERHTEAAEAVAAARAATERNEVVWPIPHLLASVIGDALRTGDLEQARVAAGEALAWSLDTEQRIGATWPQVFLSIINVHTDEPDEARAALAAAEADLAAGQWQGTEVVPWAAALVAEADGDPAAAARRLAPVVELAAAFGWNSRVPLLAPEAARTAWLAGDAEVVERMAAVTAPLAALPLIEPEAAHLRCRAFHEHDVDLHLRAAERYAALGSQTQAATALAEAVLLAARLGEHDRAVELWGTAARPALEAIGADGIVRRTLAALPVRVTRRLARRTERPQSGPEALTSAERRVAELVATGATNTEIAEQLFVSRRTVESHLSRIYRKLGVRSRVRLAAAYAAG